jgi:hypothetical protein
MVHALRELVRVVKTGGAVIDLRPQSAAWPVEVVANRKTTAVGRVTDHPQALSDDAASNATFAAAEQESWLQREDQHDFPFFYYWDSPNEMQEYIKEEWEDVSISEDVWKTLRSTWAIADGDARVRIQVKMLVARWSPIK